MKRIAGQWHRTSCQWGGDFRIVLFGYWLRLAMFYGQPPGSHIGLWRTRFGTLRGLNLRIGRRYIGPCLTLFMHTRNQRERISKLP